MVGMVHKRPPKKHPRLGGKSFWDKEYGGKKGRQHLALSMNPSEDLQKFVRFLERNSGREFLNPTLSVTDVGCGNGRNLIYLAQEFGMHGTGFDISRAAIDQARAASTELPLTYSVRSMVEPIPVPDESQALVLDMMASHFLKEPQREALRNEIFRILKPGGWFFFKTFLLDEDLNAAAMIRDYPANEPNSYIHPEIKVFEHVATEEEIEETVGSLFTIHKMYPSHRHLKSGRAHKRRSICVYAQKV